ncbi:outer membrane protein assembly factor BamB [Halarchaeum solikamskense]|uniref:PQQ-binding-like beta-propeller repeat protein n=1 Tax=Halarchaeum nitratireducens TaxID=489913 RepID=UPI001B3AE305|nr:PQQ-binding-like beta-propeller repeat protein [Halarchaeum solikamskense]MBP2251428.1 outer membrane protein assembly factor BamB [Halarchaeum solikamskense]
MPSRRRVLATTGALGAAALAGCDAVRDDGPTDDYPEGVRVRAGWPAPNRDDANTRAARDGNALESPKRAATLPGRAGTTAADGRVFAALKSGVRAYDVTGERRWSAPGLDDAPPRVLDGTVYAPHPEDPLVRGYDAATGEVTATYDLPARAVTSPVWNNGRDRFAVALADGRVAGVATDRDATWTGDPWGSVNALAVNMGSVVAATDTGEVYVYGTDGSPAWRAILDATDLVAPVVGDERLYVAGWDGTIRALDRTDGTPVWTRERGFVETPLALDGPRLYHGLGDLRAYDTATGATLWSYAPDATVRCAPAVVGDTVYVGRTDGALVALDRADGTERWTLDLGRYVGPAVAATDGAVYARGRTDDGRSATFVVTDG